MYRPDDPSFRFEGAQLLRAAFPDFPEAFANELLNILSSDWKIDFVLSILQNYEGVMAIHPVLQRIIELLPENSGHFTDIEICIESTGVVAGNFGFVEALGERKQQIESWLSDARPAVVRFAERYIPRLETRIASQQRQAEQRREQRRRDYEGDEDQSGQPE